MAESRVFALNGVSVQQVAERVESFLRDEKKMEVQSAPTQDGYLIQAKQEDTLRLLSGMKLATSVQLSVMGENLNVTLGEGQWADKLGAGAVGMIFVWPLAVTAGIGAYKQKKLPSEIFDVIARCTSSVGTVGQTVSPGYGAAAPVQNSITCPQCHAQLPQGSKFCNCCGTKIISDCPNCGAQVTPGSKFCSECGQAL